MRAVNASFPDSQCIDDNSDTVLLQNVKVQHVFSMFLFLNWVKIWIFQFVVEEQIPSNMIFQHVTRHKRIIDVCDVILFWKIKEFVYKKITHSIFTGICDTRCSTCLGFKENSIRLGIKLDVLLNLSVNVGNSGWKFLKDCLKTFQFFA